MKRKLLLASLLALALLLLKPPIPTAARERPPLASYTPAEWAWWCDATDTRCVLLPEASVPGSQTRFLVVAAGQRQTAYLSAFLGGGEVLWQGPVILDDTPWEGQLAAGEGARGLCAVSSDPAWTVCAVSPESRWTHDAPLYNTVLKGGQDE